MYVRPKQLLRAQPKQDQSNGAMAFLRLATLLIGLPALITFVHLRYVVSRHGLCFVGPAEENAVNFASPPFVSSDKTRRSEASASGDDDADVGDLSAAYGIYIKSSSQSYSQVYRAGGSRWNFGWPGITSVVSTLATPTSSLLRRQVRRGSGAPSLDHVIAYDDDRDRWCISKSNGKSLHYKDGSLVCSDSRDIRIRCPSSGVSANRRKLKGTRRNENLEQILYRPATTLLLGLNVYLAYRYWDGRISPSSVAKIYSKIVVENELWRSFSGATAHFEPLHLGFNMMSLYSLGMELEENFGSINFFLYNVSLIVLTTAVMMNLTWLRIRHTGNTALSETSTVGFSGVLFAWMVVASLERSNTCPVPFLPDMCFDTYNFWGLKFNAGPLVQLVIAQFIMPRVSFVGHLAGIICGFLVHWSLVPLSLFGPQILIPASFLAHLWIVRKCVPIERDANAEDEEALNLVEGQGDENVRSSTQRRPGERVSRRHRLLALVKNAMLAISILSLVLYDISLILSQVMVVAFYTLSVQSNALLLWYRGQSSSSVDDKRKITMEMSRGGILWRGSVLSLVLLLVTDAMTLTGWIIASINVVAERNLLVGFWPAVVIMLLRLSINFIGLCLAVGVLHDLVECGEGSFVIVFGLVLSWGREISDKMFSLFARRESVGIFEGRGNVLGGGGHAPSHTN